jgi:hypothetical protein
MSDIGATEVSFLPRVPRLKIASTVAGVLGAAFRSPMENRGASRSSWQCADRYALALVAFVPRPLAGALAHRPLGFG